MSYWSAGLYDWPRFVIAPGFSAIGLLLMASVEFLVGEEFLGQTTLEEIHAAALAEEQSSPQAGANISIQRQPM